MEDGGQDLRRSRTDDEKLSGLPDELLATSDSLLARIRDLRRLEERKRAKGISTDEFQRLADEVERRAREIWQIAASEEVIGKRAGRHDVDRGIRQTIEDIERRREGAGEASGVQPAVEMDGPATDD